MYFLYVFQVSFCRLFIKGNYAKNTQGIGKKSNWLFCTNFIFVETANFHMPYFVTYFSNLKYLFPALYFIIIVECYQNGKRFAFRQNGYILRTSSIIGVIQMGNLTKGT